MQHDVVRHAGELDLVRRRAQVGVDADEVDEGVRVADQVGAGQLDRPRTGRGGTDGVGRVGRQGDRADGLGRTGRVTDEVDVRAGQVIGTASGMRLVLFVPVLSRVNRPGLAVVPLTVITRRGRTFPPPASTRLPPALTVVTPW